MRLNARLEDIVQRIDEVGSRPDYKRGGNYNDRRVTGVKVQRAQDITEEEA